MSTTRAQVRARPVDLPKGQQAPILGRGREGVANGATRATLVVTAPAGAASVTVRLFAAATLGGEPALVGTVTVPPLGTGHISTDVAAAEYSADAMHIDPATLTVTVSFHAEG